MCSIPTKNLFSRISFRRTKSRDLPAINTSDHPSTKEQTNQSSLISFRRTKSRDLPAITLDASAEQSNSLIYKPFTYDDEIRLIVLQAGGFDEPIKCELVHVRLGERPVYDALSYVWGKEQDTDDVVVDRCGHRVGKNLFLALKHLRLEGGGRRVWIDALCIDQKNDNERGHQVSQMGVIYSRAAIVRIWLGLSDQFTEATLSIVNQMYQKEHAHFDDGTRGDFISLCSRPYWGRLWIIQEVVMASKIEIHCGNLSIPWESFSTVAYQNPEALDEIRLSGATSLCRQRLALKGNSEIRPASISLVTLMEMHMQAHCADVRDKIYGLHSFAPSCCQQAIPVDYACSAYELCGRLLVHEILQHALYANRFIISTAYRLHSLLFGGSLEQKGLQVAFELGTWESCMSKIAHRAVTTPVEAKQQGKLVWISPSLSKVWSDEQDFTVPVDLISLIEKKRTLHMHPMEKFAASQSKKETLSDITARQMELEEPLVPEVSIPRFGMVAGSTESADYATTTLRDFILSAQARLSTEVECYLALVRSEKGALHLIHTQVPAQVNDTFCAIPCGPNYFFGARQVHTLVEQGTDKILGIATLIQSFAEAGPRDYIDRNIDMTVSMVLALCESAFSMEDSQKLRGQSPSS